MTSSELTTEIRRRRKAMRAELAACGLDAAVLASEANVHYLTGYRTPSFANKARPTLLVLDADDRCVLIGSAAEAASIEGAAIDVQAGSYLEPVAVADRGLEFFPAAVAAAASVLGDAGRIGIEWSSHFLPALPPAAIESLRTSTRAELVDLAPALWRLRVRKSAYEVDRIRRSATALERAYELFAAVARPGMTERDLQRAFLGAAGASGADWIGYVLVLAGTDRPLLGGASNRRWRPGELLVLDAGLQVEGYWSDYWRIFSARAPSAKQRAAYDRVVEAVQIARAAITPGVLAAHVADTVAAALPSTGTGSFGRVGHGIGLDLTEPPSLHGQDRTRLESGMAICLEPTGHFAGVGHLAAEEMVLATDAAAELLSPPFPQQIVTVGG